MRILTPAFVTVAMLGVVAALIGGYFVKNMLARDEKVPEAKVKTVPMAVADIPAGTLITEAHIANGRLLEKKLGEDADIVLNKSVIVNRIAKEPIKAATAIHSSQLFLPGEFPSLQVGAGMRAVSLQVADSTNLVSGLIKPGQYVDVHLTPTGVPNDERTGGGLTMTLFKGVKVLALNRSQRTGGVGGGGNQVTLELSPRQSNMMILAKGHGDLTLTYNPEATATGPVIDGNADRTTFGEILGLEPLPKPEPPFITEHYRGSGRSTTPFMDGKHLDVYYATHAGRGSGYGGYGDYNGGNTLNGIDTSGMRPAPVNYWWQSYPGGSNLGAPANTTPAPAGNGPAPSGPPRYYPSARNVPPAPAGGPRT